jgi:hypothetical protein
LKDRAIHKVLCSCASKGRISKGTGLGAPHNRFTLPTLA